ncbi:MAG: metal ABC transporter permease [Microscillaceae bacterium]|jgi:manganese/zinc/iron transport system permease protein|nr:metal ABC transporter permease [Microscillaceae bacterium]
MQQLIEFFSFTNPNIRWVVLGVVLIGASSAVIGTFAYLRKRALVGDAVSHAILPGICLAFLFSGVKNPLVLLLGATFTGGLSLLAIDYITQQSKIKSDAAIALVLSVFYGVGILLLTAIQNSGNAEQSGLDKFLFGKAAALVFEDVVVFGGFSVVLLGVVWAFFPAFRLISFDMDFARSAGYPVRFLSFLLALLTVVAVAIGMQAVGVVLMSALLITPAAAARYWTHHLRMMLIISAGLGAFSGIMGAFISYTMPQMPTGPWIVAVLSLLAILSVLFGSKKGVLARYFQQKRNQSKILQENILKCFYHLGEFDNSLSASRSILDLQKKRYMPDNQLLKGIKKLLAQGLIQKNGQAYQLTDHGIREGARITKIHRLWEIFLTKHLHLADDHVHEDAEAIEHLITPELEKELEAHLNYPDTDPHQSPIPY